MRRPVLIVIKTQTFWMLMILLLGLLALLGVTGRYYRQAVQPVIYQYLAPAYIVDRRIFLDPGHGGEDPGCNDPARGIFEKDITLKVAQLIRDDLIKLGASVTMSRTDDSDHVAPKEERGNMTKKRSDLQTRIEMAQKSGADVYVSIHVNSCRNKAYAGAETFFNPKDPRSVSLAKSIQNQLRSVAGMTKRQAKEGRYFILDNTPMPSVIVEMGYLSNSKEKERLITDDYQAALAKAISFGLIDYFRALAHGTG